MIPEEGRETSSNDVLIPTRKGLDNGLHSHLLVIYFKEVVIQFRPFQYRRIFFC